MGYGFRRRHSTLALLTIVDTGTSAACRSGPPGPVAAPRLSNAETPFNSSPEPPTGPGNETPMGGKSGNSGPDPSNSVSTGASTSDSATAIAIGAPLAENW